MLPFQFVEVCATANGSESMAGAVACWAMPTQPPATKRMAHALMLHHASPAAPSAMCSQERFRSVRTRAPAQSARWPAVLDMGNLPCACMLYMRKNLPGRPARALLFVVPSRAYKLFLRTPAVPFDRPARLGYQPPPWAERHVAIYLCTHQRLLCKVPTWPAAAAVWHHLPRVWGLLRCCGT